MTAVTSNNLVLRQILECHKRAVCASVPNACGEGVHFGPTLPVGRQGSWHASDPVARQPFQHLETYPTSAGIPIRGELEHHTRGVRSESGYPLHATFLSPHGPLTQVPKTRMRGGQASLPPHAQRLRAIQLSIDTPLCQGNAVPQSRLSRLERFTRVAPEGLPPLVWWTDNATAPEPAHGTHNRGRNNVETSVELAHLLRGHGDGPKWNTILPLAQTEAPPPKQFLLEVLTGRYLSAGRPSMRRSSSDRWMISCISAESHPSFHSRRSNVCFVSPRVAPRYGFPLSGTDARYARAPSSFALDRREFMRNVLQTSFPALVDEGTMAGQRLKFRASKELLNVRHQHHGERLTLCSQPNSSRMDVPPALLVGGECLRPSDHLASRKDRQRFKGHPANVAVAANSEVKQHMLQVWLELSVHVHGALWMKGTSDSAPRANRNRSMVREELTDG